MLTHAPFDPYFPEPIGPLVGLLWADALCRAGMDVTYDDGRLWIDLDQVDDLAGTADDGAISDPAAALEYWHATLEPRYIHLTAQIERSSAIGDPHTAWAQARDAWLTLIALYFSNPIRDAVETARLETLGRRTRIAPSMAACLASLSDLASRLPNPTVTLSDARRLSPVMRAALAEHLDRWGAYSLRPEDISSPYPREAPALLAASLARPIRVPDQPEIHDPLELLAEVAEDDNLHKYEACFHLRQAALRLARSRHWPELDVPDGVWSRDPWTLELADRPVPRRVEVRTVDHVDGAPLAPGEATGIVWDGTTEPPGTEDLILVTCDVGPAAVAAWLASSGVICENASIDAHAVIVARSVGIPVVTAGDATHLLAPGTPVRIDGSTGAIAIQAA